MRQLMFAALAIAVVGLSVDAADADKPDKPKKKGGPLPTDPAELFKYLDTGPDGTPDGKLSLDEFLELGPKLPMTKKTKAAPPDLKNIFNSLDRNADGFLTPGEFKTIDTLVELSPPKKKK